MDGESTYVDFYVSCARLDVDKLVKLLRPNTEDLSAWALDVSMSSVPKLLL